MSFLSPADVQVIEVRIPTMSVPTVKTTLMCYTVDVPSGDNQVIAWEPIIDNAYVVHHMQVLGCIEEGAHHSWNEVWGAIAYPCAATPIAEKKPGYRNQG